MNWHFAAITLQGIVLAYYLITEWVHLFPWNNVALLSTQHKLVSSLVNGGPILIFLIGFLLRTRPLMLGAVVFYAVWLALQIKIWWVPYLFGATPEQQYEYERLFSGTYKLLPAIGDHPVPDVQHMVLQFLSLLTIVASAAAVRAR